MNLILSPHNVTLTKAIEDHLISRINKLDHLDHYAVNVRVTLEHDRTKAPERQFSCSMRLAMRGPDLFVVRVVLSERGKLPSVQKVVEAERNGG